MVDPGNRYTTGQRLLLTALWLSLLSFTVKLLLGWQTQSLALLAESLHGAIAAVSAIFAVIACQNLARCGGRELLGHTRFESMTCFLLIGVLGFGCFSLSGIALQHLVAAHQLTQTPQLNMIQPSQLQALLLFGLAGLGLATVQKRTAKRTGLRPVSASADHIFWDAILTLITLLTLIAVQNGYSWLDSIVTLIMSTSAILNSWRLLHRQLPLITHQIAIAPEAIAHLVRQIDGVTNCYQIRSRGLVGRQVLVQMRLMIHPEFLGTEGKIIQQIEAALRETYGPIKVAIKVDSDWQGLETALETASQANSVSGID
jgi:cation diffusion facilitator family transporter